MINIVSELSYKAINCHIKDDSIWLYPCEDSQAVSKHLGCPAVNRCGKQSTQIWHAKPCLVAFCSISHALAPTSLDWKKLGYPSTKACLEKHVQRLFNSVRMSPCCLRVTCFPGSIVHRQSHHKVLVSFKAPSKVAMTILNYFSPAVYNFFFNKEDQKKKGGGGGAG